MTGGKAETGKRPVGIDAMHATPRCKAKSKRSGKPCRAAAVRGKSVCYVHGGAPGSGGQRGNTNALKHGRRTREAIEEMREARRLLRAIAETTGE